jgi:hypothetical protein
MILRALALGLIVTLPALAADQDTPACDLLLEADVSEAFGLPATESIINPEMTGASDCSWIGGETASLALSRSRDLAFQGNSTAADGYRNWRDNFASGGRLEDLKGIGEAAFVFTPKGAKDDAGTIVGVLVQGNVLIMGNSSLSRGALLKLAARAAGRI